ncbi:T-cell immunomodulatory protein-like [Corticium candelabrum]|uniref:T-cell immunomodulatory protein-like n=1 Tax=Corticium candelabrum TaxID=121492 RepID=UPI002E2588E4|nr:T-cell immunomodulatory protein-like [Corticium candelabrum]
MVAFSSSDVTLLIFVLCVLSSVNGYTGDGFISSLGDVNGDKSLDIVTLTYTSRDASFSVNLGLWNADKSFYDIKEVLKFNDWSKGVITSSYLADFDSDGKLDLLLTSRLLESRDSTELSAQVLWGNGTNFSLPSYSFSSLWCSEYLVADVNGDEVADVIAKECNGSLKVWISNVKMRNFTESAIKEYVDCLSLDTPISSDSALAFVDINQDLMADIVVINRNGTSQSLSVFLRLTDGSWQCCPMPAIQSYLTPRPSFTDFDADGTMDIMLPVCSSSNCLDANVLIMFNAMSSPQDCPTFETLNISLSHVVGEELGVRFASILIFPSVSELSIPTWIRTGDYNLDTYPDVLMVAMVMSSNKYQAFLLENTDCSTSYNCGRGRTLKQVNIKKVNPEGGDVKLALFHNIDDDGDWDILLNVVSDNTQKVEIQIIQNTLNSDANFLSVDVMTAACVRPPNCDKDVGYGVSQLGATVEFSTTGSYGRKIRSTSGQISKSGSFSCSLPYVIFGLSRSSTFIEHLTVGIPYVKEKGRSTKTRSSIIPNSHLYIIPQPSDDPDNWRNVLLVNPSNKVLYTLIVFVNTCVVFGVIVGLLQWREKRQDEREKRQEAHKFHFDAM